MMMLFRVFSVFRGSAVPQSSGCTWADAVGQKLSIYGIDDVTIYRPGWNRLKNECKSEWEVKKNDSKG